jgi:hypothetical protein
MARDAWQKHLRQPAGHTLPVTMHGTPAHTCLLCSKWLAGLQFTSQGTWCERHNSAHANAVAYCPGLLDTAAPSARAATVKTLQALLLVQSCLLAAAAAAASSSKSAAGCEEE